MLLNTYKTTGSLIFLTAALLAAAVSAGPNETSLPKNDSCISCHVEIDFLPEDYQSYDIHLQDGLSCSGCHGGRPDLEDPEQAMDESAGFVARPDNKDIPGLCGRCHSNIEFMREYQPRINTDQVEQYYTSVHGKQLKRGDQKVAECANCHTAHAILSAADPRSSVYALNVPATCNHCHGDQDYMREYGISTDQMELYASSVHGKALLEELDTGAPACNDCHGNHGAMPPDVQSISHVCGSCHVNNMRFFASSRMSKVFEENDIHACEECHGNHAVMKTSDAMIGEGPESVCVDCHSDDAGMRVAVSIRAQLDSVSHRIDSAKTSLKQVRKIGMDDVDITYLLKEAHQNVIQARTLVHTFDVSKVQEQTSPALKKAAEAIELANAKIEDSKNRRLGLGFASLFIAIIVITLFFKIKSLE